MPSDILSKKVVIRHGYSLLYLLYLLYKITWDIGTGSITIRNRYSRYWSLSFIYRELHPVTDGSFLLLLLLPLALPQASAIWKMTLKSSFNQNHPLMASYCPGFVTGFLGIDYNEEYNKGVWTVIISSVGSLKVILHVDDVFIVYYFVHCV